MQRQNQPFVPAISSLVPVKLSVALGAALAMAAVAPHLALAQQAGPGVYAVSALANPLGGTASIGNSLNQRGWIAGAAFQPGGASEHAALWRRGRAPLDLGTLGGPNSAVAWPNHSERGQIVGIAETAATDPLGEAWSCGLAVFPTVTGHTCLGFVWQDGTMTALPTLGGDNGFATGNNNRDEIVGWAENTTHDPTCNAPQVLQFEAVIWNPRVGSVRVLPPLPGDYDGAATSINDRSQVVGISGLCSNAVGGLSAEHAVLWEHGTPIDIGNLGGAAWNTPMDLNERGDAVGFSDLPGDQNGANINFHAFLWTRDDGIRDLGTLPGDALSEALGVNERRQVVGVSFGAGFTHPRAFLWQDGTMIDLNTRLAPGTTLYLIDAQEINDRGEITGQATDPATGDAPAFLAVPSSAQ